MENSASKSWYDTVEEEEGSKVQELMDVISTLNLKLSKASDDLNILREKKEDYKNRLEKRCRMFVEMISKWEDQKMVWVKELKQSQTTILELQEERDLQVQRSENLQKKLEEVNHKYLEVSKREQTLTETLSEADSLLRECRRQLKVARKDEELINSLKKENKSLSRSLQTKCKLYLESDSDWTIKMAALNKDLTEKKRCNLELSSKLTAQEEENQRLEEEVRGLREEKDHQKLKADNLEKQLQEVSQTNLEACNQDQIKDLVEERDSLRKELETLKKEALSRQTSDQETNTEPLPPAADAAEMVQREEQISSWRRFKKFMTPNSRRQFKQQRRLKMDQE